MNYVTPISVFGMLPAHAEFIPGNNMVAYKNGKKDSIISWDPNYINVELPVSYMYADSVPASGVKSKIKRYQLINGPFDAEFFTYRGNRGRHFRECRNRFARKLGVKVETECLTGSVLDLIRRWENDHGRSSYRMQMHSSYDKRFFKSSRAILGDAVDVLYFMHAGKCIGYKVMDSKPIERPDGILEFRSMLRKYDPSYKRICLYIDMTAYAFLWNKWHRTFCVNVGCSSGGVAAYKREKFPVMDPGDPVFFYKNVIDKKA